MRRGLALLLCVWLGLGVPVQAEAFAGAPAPPVAAASNVAAFNLRAQPLPKPYEGLLLKNKYDVRTDGTVWTPDGKEAVSQAEMPFLLHRLESGQRLKALLQLDMLLSASDGEKYLSPVERENLRGIVRDNWPFFTLGTRKDFRHFFSLQEQEQMNRDPAPTDSATALTMSDPEPQDYTDAELPPALKPVPMPRLLPAPPPPQAAYADDLPAPRAPGNGVAPAVYYVAAMAPGAAPVAAVAMAPAALPNAAAALPPLMPASAGSLPAPAAAPAPAAVTATPAPASAPAPEPIRAQVPTPAAMAAVANSAQFPPGMAVAGAAPAVPAELIGAGAAAPAAPKLAPAAAQAAYQEAPIAVRASAAGGTSVPATVAPQAAAKPPLPNVAVAAAAPAPAVVTPAQAAQGAPASGPFIPAPVQAAVAAGAGPPAKVAPTPQLPPAPAPAVAAPLPPTQPVAEAGLPPVRVVSQDEFERFLADAPYGHEAKGLLRLISQKALEPSRSRALGAAMNALPQIVFDTARAGLDAHGALLAIETPEMHAYTIALSPGPIVLQRKKMFSSGPTIMLADSAKIYASLHAPMPNVEALKKDAPAVKVQEGPYGAERLYSDDSRRGVYSDPQTAGYLLRKLLRLDAKRGGWDASAYAAEAYARSAQWIFYARVLLDMKSDSFLDPETRAAFRSWRDQPEEYRDYLVHTLSAGRVQTLDPRKGNAERQAEFDRAAASGDCVGTFKADIQARLDADREALKKDALALSRAGLLEDDGLESSRKAIDADFAAVRLPQPTPQQCSARYASEAAQLRSSAALFAEMSQSERAFRGAAQ